MSKIIWIIAIVALSGCATKAPKEDLRSVYQLVKERKFDQAETKLVDTSGKSMLGQFDSYAGVSVKAVSDSGEYVFKKIQGTINYCDKQIQEIKMANLDNSEDENQWDKFKLDEAKEEFGQHCAENEESVVEAQRISSVDFKSMFRDMAAQFEKESKRISTQFTHKQEKSEKEAADAVVAKEKYEQSEEYYSKKLCEMKSIIKAANSIITRENEAAGVSGFVDKKKLYEAGQAVTVNQKRVQHFGVEYKRRFGKSWTPASCK